MGSGHLLFSRFLPRVLQGTSKTDTIQRSSHVTSQNDPNSTAGALVHQHASAAPLYGQLLVLQEKQSSAKSGQTCELDGG